MDINLKQGIISVFHLEVLKGSTLKYYYYSFVYLSAHLPFIPRKKVLKYLQTKQELFTIKNRIGKFKCRFNDDSFIKSSDIFEQQYQHFLQQKNKDILLDIGANIGFYSVLALNKYNYKKVYAFEPDKKTFEYLKENKRINNLDATLFNLGLGECNKEVKFQENIFHTGANKITNKGKKKISVRVGDALLSEEQKKRVTFIKIDVEGYEYNVLQGLEETLAKMMKDTKLFIEITENKDKIQSLLRLKGFKMQKKIGRNYAFMKSS